MTSWIRSIGVALLLLVAAHARAEAPLEPVSRSNVSMRADRATLVQQDGVKLLLLEGDVAVSIGAYGFRDQSAVVRITRRPGPGAWLPRHRTCDPGRRGDPHR